MNPTWLVCLALVPALLAGCTSPQESTQDCPTPATAAGNKYVPGATDTSGGNLSSGNETGDGACPDALDNSSTQTNES